jgi:hypothetical protein
MKAINKKLILGLSFVILLNTGCEKTEDDQTNQAQDCLDHATVPADAAQCFTMINGIHNEKANRIRCALTILEDGTTQTEIVNAFHAMEVPNGHDPIIDIATVLGLGDVAPIGAPDGTVDAAEEALAQNIKDVCYDTSSIGLKTIADLILFGTRAQIAADAALGDPENANDIQTWILTMQDQDAGEFANDVYDLYCVPVFSNQDICTTLDHAGAGSGTDAAVGANLKACLQTNTCQ